MSNEIQFSTGLSLQNGSLSASQSESTSADQTTAGSVQREQDIPTSVTTIDLSGVPSPRAIHIVNDDDTNYVDIGAYTSGVFAPIAQLKPGEPMVVPLFPGVVLKAQANTASVKIVFLILDT